MAVMSVAMASPAFAAGNHFARGQDNSNPGFNNDSVGDDANDVCFNHGNCNPTFDLTKKAQGEGTGEN